MNNFQADIRQIARPNPLFSAWSVLLIWTVMQGVIFSYYGVVTEYEATKYIEQAQRLESGFGFSSRNFQYYGFISLMIWLSLKLGIGFGVVVALQMFMSGASLYFFYKIILSLTTNRVSAFCASVALASMFYYQAYNTYLFSESFFFSFTIFLSYVIFLQSGIKRIVFTAGLLLLLIFCRPTGILFIPPVLLFFLTKMNKLQRVGMSIVFFVGLTGFVLLLNRVMTSGGELNFILPYAEEHVICGVPTKQPGSTFILSQNPNTSIGLVELIYRQPNLVLKLAGKRLVAFFGVYRTWYSFGHNLFICAYFFTIYVCIILSLRTWYRFNFSVLVFLISYLIMLSLAVALSCDEWHNRFIYSLLPYLILLASGVSLKGRMSLVN